MKHALPSRRRKALRYRSDSEAMPQQPNQHHQVGETKTENGRSYRLSEHHRWQRTDKDQPQGDDKQPGKPAAGPSLEERKTFAKSQLKSIDKDIGGLIRAFHASPEFKGSGEFSSHNVAPEQAESAYNDMRRNVGRSWGGGEVRELGDGRIGFSSPAGAFAMAPPSEPGGKWRTSYTVMTGPVQRAMGGSKPDQLPDGNAEASPPEAQQPENVAPQTGPDTPPVPENKAAPASRSPDARQTLAAEHPFLTGHGGKVAPATAAAAPTPPEVQKSAENPPPLPPVTTQTLKTPEPGTAFPQSDGKPGTQIEPTGYTNQPQAAKPGTTAPPKTPEIGTPSESVAPHVALHSATRGQEASKQESTEVNTDEQPGPVHVRLRDTANKIKQRLDDAVLAQDDALRSGDPKAAKLARGKVSLLRSYHKDAERSARDAEAEHAKAGRKEAPGQKPFHEQTRAEFAAHAPAERHKQHVKTALAAGQQVPPEVLADYPELQQQAADVEYANPDDKASDDRYFAREGKKANALVESLRKQLADKMGPTNVDPAKLAEKFPQAPPEQLKQLAELSPDEVQSLAKTLGVKVPKRTPHTEAIEKVLTGIFGNKPGAGASTKPAAPAPEKPVAAQPRVVTEPPKPFESKPLESYSPEMQARAAAIFAGQAPEQMLAKIGLPSGAKSIDAIHKAIDSGVIADAGDLSKVLATANQLNRRSGLKVDAMESLSKAIGQHGASKDRAAAPDPIAEAAAQHKVDPKELAAAVDELSVGERQQQEEREAVKTAMRKTLGLDAAGIARLENANKDYTAIPGYDEKVRQLAGEFPEFLGGQASHEGGGDTEEAAQKVWSMVREGRRPLDPKHKWIPQALEMLLHEEKPLTPEQERLRAVPFAKRDEKIRYARTPEEIRQAVAEAAKATHRSPSMEQREAGNYPKGKCHIHGLEIAIETPRGAFREGISKDGTPWRVKMNGGHYGYFKRRIAESDGDNLDVFVGPNPENDFVFVIDQVRPETGRFDESKVMLGYSNEQAAKDAYFSSYTPGWRGFKSITPMHMAEFRDWLEKGDSSKPIAKQFGRVLSA